ncbi:MAG: aspartate kinase [Rickettsiaceae bacterium]|nr:aspartate kinase [Rickettsiaceae bacterium]
MSFIVLKFGGTSAGNVERIKEIAKIVSEIKNKGHDVIIVVSAMSGTTNKILSLCMDISANNSAKKSLEIDHALSTGETLSASLLALALIERGIDAKSMQGWQAGIKSNSNYNNALVEEFDPHILISIVKKGITPIVAGFQAIDQFGSITTIGRGGSDTTAAIIAAGVRADSCDIYTDVQGFYTTDPRLVKEARQIQLLSFEEAIELAGTGAKILHPRAVEICMRYNIILRVFSTFNKKLGTEIMTKVNETRKITGISYQKNLARVKMENSKISLINLTQEMIKDGININHILYCGKDSFEFILNREFLVKMENLFRNIFNEQIGGEVQIEKQVASVTILGAGISHDVNILHKTLSLFEQNNIQILGLLNSEIKLTFFISEDAAEKIVKLLHYELIENA